MELKTAIEILEKRKCDVEPKELTEALDVMLSEIKKFEKVKLMYYKHNLTIQQD